MDDAAARAVGGGVAQRTHRTRPGPSTRPHRLAPAPTVGLDVDPRPPPPAGADLPGLVDRRGARPVSARDDVLARIRHAHAAAPTPPPRVPRDYRRADDRPHRDLVDLLEQRLVDYRAVAPRGAAPRTIAGVLGGRGLESRVVPDGVPDAGRDAVRETVRGAGDDPPLTAQELDG